LPSLTNSINLPITNSNKLKEDEQPSTAGLALRAYSCPDLLELECHTSQTDPLPACLHPEVTGVITEAEPTQIHEDLVGLEHSS
jgi:hypothetical protein